MGEPKYMREAEWADGTKKSQPAYSNSSVGVARMYLMQRGPLQTEERPDVIRMLKGDEIIWQFDEINKRFMHCPIAHIAERDGAVLTDVEDEA